MSKMRFYAKVIFLISISSLCIIGLFKYNFPDSELFDKKINLKSFDDGTSSNIGRNPFDRDTENRKLKTDGNLETPFPMPSFDNEEKQTEEKSPKISLGEFSTLKEKKIVELSLPQRIVHLDLKGAPPKISYLIELMPFLRRLGATGLLIEYEDMFPYTGNYSMLRNGYSYTVDEIKKILKSAEINNLTVIPLVQTFGHMEWVLKHKNFEDIREIHRYPQVSCPSNDETFKIVKKLIDQIVLLHPKIDSIHIGADEAYYVGKECKKCKDKISELGSKQKLMLHYVVKVAKYVKNKHRLRVLTWNDMFQDADPNELVQSGIDKLVEPVIWGYSTNLVYSDYFPSGVFDRFGSTFGSLWVASAFKGANGPSQTFIDVEKYAQNHLSWIHLLNLAKKTENQYKGIILTGWSRFDHFAVLCEIFSVGIPSLAVDLQLMGNGGMIKKAYEDARKVLNCDNVYNQSSFPEMKLLSKSFENSAGTSPVPSLPLGTAECSYPGSSVSKLVERLRIVRYAADTFLQSNEAQGWLSDYNLKEQYGSVFMAEKGYNRTQEINGYFKPLGGELRKEMMKLYYEDTVDEWLYQNIQIHTNKLDIVARSTLTLMHSTSFRNRPLARLDLDL